jgi:hypothetical protein
MGLLGIEEDDFGGSSREGREGIYGVTTEQEWMDWRRDMQPVGQQVLL